MSWERACQFEDQLSEEVAELIDRVEKVDTDVVDDQSLPEEIARRIERL